MTQIIKNKNKWYHGVFHISLNLNCIILEEGKCGTTSAVQSQKAVVSTYCLLALQSRLVMHRVAVKYMLSATPCQRRCYNDQCTTNLVWTDLLRSSANKSYAYCVIDWSAVFKKKKHNKQKQIILINYDGYKCAHLFRWIEIETNTSQLGHGLLVPLHM